jgi:cyanophycinase
MKTKQPKGILIPIGGAEDRIDRKEVLGRVIKESGKKNPLICVISLATGNSKDAAKIYRKAFKSLDHTSVCFIHFDNRSDADNKNDLKKLENCDIVLFSGGDQLKLSSLLGGTRILSLIKERYNNESKFVVAGTSAGAAAMSDTMIISGSSKDAMIKGELELTNGLDFISSVFIDTHFTERGRFGRLIQTVTNNPGILGVGVGEDTAVVISKGEILEVVGSGLAVIIDGTGILYSDLAEREHGEVVTVEGIQMHILGPKKRFVLSEKKIHPGDKLSTNQK